MCVTRSDATSAKKKKASMTLRTVLGISHVVLRIWFATAAIVGLGRLVSGLAKTNVANKENLWMSSALQLSNVEKQGRKWQESTESAIHVWSDSKKSSRKYLNAALNTSRRNRGNEGASFFRCLSFKHTSNFSSSRTALSS